MCDDNQSAGTVYLPVQTLIDLDREHPSYWEMGSADKVAYATYMHPRHESEEADLNSWMDCHICRAQLESHGRKG